jgi:hypothetical protein
MEYAGPNDKVEADRGSPSPLPETSIAIPSLLKPALQTAPPPNHQLAADDPSLGDRTDFGIGVIICLVTRIILASTSQMDVFNNLGKLTLLGGEVLLGVLGAFASKSWGRNCRGIWIGAIE